MPIYSYKCTQCDHRFEARQRFTDDPLTECPVCGSLVRKVITPVGIVFKGSGFYVTDNKNGKSSSVNGTAPDTSNKSTESKEKATGETSSVKSKSATDSASASSAA